MHFYTLVCFSNMQVSGLCRHITKLSYQTFHFPSILLTDNVRGGLAYSFVYQIQWRIILELMNYLKKKAKKYKL